jgi:hypothetical protein
MSLVPGMKRIGRALRSYLVVRVWTLWAGVGVPIVLVMAARRFPSGGGLSDPERDLIVGVLELAGLGLIAKGYADLRSEFGRPGMVAATKSYVREFVAALRGPRRLELKATAAGTAFVAGSARLTVKPAPDTPLEKRVAILERTVTDLTSELDASTSKLSRELTSVRTQVETERTSRERQLTEVRSLLESASIGSPGLEVLGWLWLIAGVLVAVTPSVTLVFRAAP